MSISVATLNVRGLCSQKRQHHFHRLLFDACLDIVAVQESKLSSEARDDQALKSYLCSNEVCVSRGRNVGRLSNVLEKIVAVVPPQPFN